MPHDPTNVYFYNAQAEVHALGLAWDPEADAAYYLSAAGAKNSLRSIWASLLLRKPSDAAEIKMHNGWIYNAFKGPPDGVHQEWAALKGTTLWQAVFHPKSPFLLFVEDHRGVHCPDSSDVEDMAERHALLDALMPQVHTRLAYLLNKASDFPIAHQWGKTLWEMAIEEGAIQSLDCYGDCLGAWRIDPKARWKNLIQAGFTEGRLSIPKP